MAGAARRSGSARSRRGGLAVLLGLLLALSAQTSTPPPAAAGGPPADQVVAAVTGGYALPGTLGVAVARQEVPVAGLPPRAVEARSARLAAWTAGNAAADRPFPTASMVKLYVAEDILHRARTGGLALSPADLGLMQEMIRSSDDPAASALWVRYGGGQMVRDVAARYGLTGTAPPAVPGQWGQAWTTPRDLARFLARLPTLAHPDDAAVLLSWMRSATPIAADGFDQRFGLFGTAPGQPAVKQGWMCCVGGNRHLHSVAVVGTRVLVLLSEFSRTLGYDTGRAALTAAGAAVPPPVQPRGG